MSIFDIEFDDLYGDFTVNNGDIVLVNSYRKYLKNYVVNKLKTQVGDVYGLTAGGMPFDSYIGKGLDQRALEDLEKEILFDLLADKVLLENEIEIFTLYKNNTLYVRVAINKETLEMTVGVTVDKNGDISSD